jgi:hypothetical protein
MVSNKSLKQRANLRSRLAWQNGYLTLFDSLENGEATEGCPLSAVCRTSSYGGQHSSELVARPSHSAVE